MKKDSVIGSDKAMKVTIIRVRRGFGDARYCACDNLGNPIQGFAKLSDVRKNWEKEIRWGYVRLVRELDEVPCMQTINKTQRCLQMILKLYAKTEEM